MFKNLSYMQRRSLGDRFRLSIAKQAGYIINPYSFGTGGGGGGGGGETDPFFSSLVTG